MVQRIQQHEQPAMMISRKRQRSAEQHDDDNNAKVAAQRQQQNAKTLSSSSSSSHISIRKKATTIVATVLASSLGPAMAAEENLLHPGVQPLYPATATASTANKAASSTTRKISCQDDPDFVSSMGLTCRDHQEHGCKQAGIEELGYDLAGMVELLQHCPVTCQVPPCENHLHDLIREDGHDQEQDQDGTITAAAISSHRTLLNSDDGSDGAEAILEGQSVSSGLRGGNNPDQRAFPNMVHDSGVFDSCFDGWHPFCQDDPYYVSKTGLPCEFHSSFDCSAWTNVGYTDMEVYELINSCPCSCAVPCGTWTMEPSQAPSDMPSVSPTNLPTTSPTDLPSASPSAPPTESPYCFNEQCIDDENYRSKNNLPCHLHGSLDCRAWGAVGYSLEEVFELINSCPCTCGIECGSYTHEPSAAPSQSPSVSPTDLPSVSPSDVPTEMPSTSPTISNACYPGWSHYCQDDPEYRSPQGLRCEFHGSVDCYTWSEAGYSDEEILELVVRCPCSCKIPCGEVTFEPTQFPTMEPSPSPSAAPSFTPTQYPTRTPTLPPTPGPTTPKPTPRPTHPPTPAPTAHPTQSPTAPPSPSPTTAAPTLNPTESPYCFDDQCIDDENWRSKNGMPCELHGSIHCLQWGSVGYSQQEIFELITACPCTCNIPCGTFTLNPTSSPTMAPSPFPTDEPTQRPTTAAPSHLPSAVPTKRPSSTPSSTPSVSPTISFAPTVSQEPSASPTISFAPTISPRPTMWFEATARINAPIVEDGDGSIFTSIGFLIGVAVGGLGLIMLSVYSIYRYRVNNRGFSDTDDEEGGCFSCCRRNKSGVNINGKVEIMGLRRISKERPNREEIEERPFYSNLMNLIQPQQTKDHDEWNDTRWWGKGKQHNDGHGHQRDDRNRRSRANQRGDRTYNSTPASILASPNAAATLFSCGVGENTLCRSAPTKGGCRDDMSQDSYNFTVETPFTNHTGRSSGQSSRQSSRYDDSTAAGDTYADNTYADNTYADDTYASRSTADSRNRRSRGKPSKSKSKSTSRSRSRRSRYDRYDQGTVESNTYADEEEFSEDSSYDD